MGYKIRECREEMGISQEELAKRAKISRTTLSGLESGAIKTTTTDTSLKIAEALNKKVTDIFFFFEVQHIKLGTRWCRWMKEKHAQ